MDQKEPQDQPEFHLSHQLPNEKQPNCTAAQLQALLIRSLLLQWLEAEASRARCFPLEEVDKIEKYIGGLPDMILGSVKASKSKTMQEVIEFTTELMEDKNHAYAERQAERKRKNDDFSKNNQDQQNKRQNTGRPTLRGNVKEIIRRV
ncbi:hypothetical protein Tco_1553481 [Tanacetum coccineum]